jgi:hypothetical protein
LTVSVLLWLTTHSDTLSTSSNSCIFCTNFIYSLWPKCQPVCEIVHLYSFFTSNAWNLSFDYNSIIVIYNPFVHPLPLSHVSFVIILNILFFFQAFSIFTGLGIHNCQMYENACRLMAKQTVALEVLSFHATAGQEETERLAEVVLIFNLYQFIIPLNTLSFNLFISLHLTSWKCIMDQSEFRAVFSIQCIKAAFSFYFLLAKQFCAVSK